MCRSAIDGAKSASATFGRVADPTPPRVRALASEGELGRSRSSATASSRRAARAVRRSRSSVAHGVRPFAASCTRSTPDTLFYFIRWRSTARGSLRFCVVSTDTAGNRSKRAARPFTSPRMRPQRPPFSRSRSAGLLPGCGGDDETTAASPTAAAPTPPQRRPRPASHRHRLPRLPKPEVETVRIVVRGGKVVGGLRATVEQGEGGHRRRLRRRRPRAPPRVRRVRRRHAGQGGAALFVASIPGRFEVELEDRGLQIADLEVRP